MNPRSTLLATLFLSSFGCCYENFHDAELQYKGMVLDVHGLEGKVYVADDEDCGDEDAKIRKTRWLVNDRPMDSGRKEYFLGVEALKKEGGHWTQSAALQFPEDGVERVLTFEATIGSPDGSGVYSESVTFVGNVLRTEPPLSDAGPNEDPDASPDASLDAGLDGSADASGDASADGG